MHPDAHNIRKRRVSLRLLFRVAVALVTTQGPGALADDNPKNNGPVLLRVLPGPLGETRTQTTVTEWVITRTPYDQNGQMTPDARILTSKAETYELRTTALSAETVSYTRRLKRFRFMRIELRDNREPVGIFLDTQCEPDRNPAVDSQLSTIEQIVAAFDGSIRRHKASGPDQEFNATLQIKTERDIENAVRLFPGHPVRVDETWDLGRQEHSASGLALVTRDLQARLIDVVSAVPPPPAERTARIAIEGTNAQMKPDKERFSTGDVAFIVRKFEDRGQILLSLDRNEVLSRSEDIEFAVEFESKQAGASPRDLVAGTTTIRTKPGTIEDIGSSAVFMDQIASLGNASGLAAIFHKRGEQYFGGDLSCADAAIGAVTITIQLDKENAVAHVARGVAYLLGANRPKAAIADFSRALDIGFNDDGGLLTRLYRGHAYLKERNFADAIADFTQVIETKPDVWGGFHARALAHLRAGQPNFGLRDVERAIELAGPPDLRTISNFHLRGLIREALGMSREASVDFSTALNRWTLCKDPDAAPTLSRASFCELGFFGHRFTDAWAALKRVGGYDQAIEDRVSGYDQQPNIHPFLERADAHIKAGDFDSAIEEYSEAIRLDPDRAHGFFGRAAVYAMKGDLDRAVAEYGEAIRLGPYRPQHFTRRAVVYFFMGDAVAAMADLERANSLISLWNKPEWMLWRYLVRARMGHDPTEEFAAGVSGVQANEWLKPLIEVYLGRRTASELRATAEYSARKCSMALFLGELLLTRGELAEAAKELGAGAETCQKGSTGYIGAIAELRRLRQ